MIQSFDNLHDNRVLRYFANFEAHTLCMDTQTEAGEKVSVHFTSLLIHWFENVIQDNILFGTDGITAGDFLNNTKTCWTRLSLTAFPPVAASRNCGSGWSRRSSGSPPLGCVDLYWPRRRPPKSCCIFESWLLPGGCLEPELHPTGAGRLRADFLAGDSHPSETVYRLVAGGAGLHLGSGKAAPLHYRNRQYWVLRDQLLL